MWRRLHFYFCKSEQFNICICILKSELFCFYEESMTIVELRILFNSAFTRYSCVNRIRKSFSQKLIYCLC